MLDELFETLNLYFYSRFARFARILYTDRIEDTSIEFTRKLDLAGNW